MMITSLISTTSLCIFVEYPAIINNHAIIAKQSQDPSLVSANYPAKPPDWNIYRRPCQSHRYPLRSPNSCWRAYRRIRLRIGCSDGRRPVWRYRRFRADIRFSFPDQADFLAQTWRRLVSSLSWSEDFYSCAHHYWGHKFLHHLE